MRTTDTRTTDTRITDTRITDTRITDTRITNRRTKDTKINDIRTSDTITTNKSVRNTKSGKISIKDICLIGIMVAVIEVCKAAVSMPNIELTTFWLIMFTLFWDRKVTLVVPVFILLEGCVYGFGSWWIMYLYTWPLLVLVVWLFRRQESVWFWSVLSAVFGLLFGFFCSFPYVVMGAWDGGIRGGLYAGFTWWVAGIPWDIVHGISNFILMIVLYHPIRTMILHVKKEIL